MRSYSEVVPHRALRLYVDRFWMQTDGTVAPTEPFRVLPDGCIDVLVDCVRDSAVAVGTMTRALVMVPRVGVRVVAVRFRPGGAVPFLRTPADLLTDNAVPCVDLEVGDLVPRGLGDGETLLAAVARLEQSLLSKLGGLPSPDLRVRHAVRALGGAEPVTVDALAERVGWTRQHLGRTMRAHTGIGPKQLARTMRLQRAVTLLQRRPLASIAEVAATAGYFDQAHMAADFRDLAGAAPRVVRQATGSIFPIPSLFEEP